ncbi:MAG: hypothetical protein WB988_20575, partial [Candidatus Nitrosopolaris sp.]
MDRKINHILGRVHHPQTNDKIERFYETFRHSPTLVTKDKTVMISNFAAAALLLLAFGTMGH